jgi:hypothetical protein
MGEPGIADRAEAGSVFLPLEPALIALSIHFPSPYNDPRNTEASDRPYQPGAGPFPVTCNTEVKTLAKANIVTGVIEFGFEVGQMDIRFYGYLQTKEGLLIRVALLSLLNVFIVRLDNPHSVYDHSDNQEDRRNGACALEPSLAYFGKPTKVGIVRC